MYKLLVVDDEPKIREVIREYAEFNGYEVTEAEDGMSAVGLCKLNHYDLVILDIMMPKLDGFSACKEIKKIQDVPIIMLSARGEEYDKLFGFELGIDDYIVKPFSPKELMARINVVLGSQTRIRTQQIRRDEIRRSGNQYRCPYRHRGWQTRRPDAERIRTAVLSDREPKHRPFPGQASLRYLGLRFLRRRPDHRHPYQKSPEQSGALQRLYRYAQRGRIQI